MVNTEAFGLVPLEALLNDTPVLISKQSGVSEVLTHALKVDFWDVDEMANQILSTLRHPELHRELRKNGKRDILGLTWQESAQQCVKLYNKMLTAERA